MNPSADNPSVVTSIIESRRTIASFQPECPPRQVIREALDSVRWAPNHKKTEPWRVYWLGPETMRAVIALNTKILTESKGATEAESKSRKWAQVPGWLVLTCELADDSFRREEDYAACCCAIQNLQLALWSRQIGTKWSTGEVIRHPTFFNLLGIDSARERVVGLLWYGYPAIIPEQNRRPLESFLKELP